MADAIGLAASILALVSATYKSCKTLNDTISGLEDAPGHVIAIADDLQDFYSILGALQSALEDEAGVIEPAMSGHLSQVLKHCLEIFKATSSIVGEYDDRNRSIVGLSAWKRLKWTFKEKEVDDARKNLMHCKLTFNTAISVASWWVPMSVITQPFILAQDSRYNLRMVTAIASQNETMNSTTETTMAIIKEELAAYTQELETKLPGIMEQLEDLKALQGPHPPEHDAQDRSMVKEDFTYALRHYLDGASSICSDWTDRSTPSFQVSSFQPTNSLRTTVYQTAKTHLTAEAGNAAETSDCISLFISGMGRTAFVRIQPCALLSDLKNSIQRIIELPGTELNLMHQGRLVSENDNSLKELGINHNSRLTCTFKHKRPLTPPPTDPPKFKPLLKRSSRNRSTHTSRGR